jgi:hypothetical protein
MSQRNLLVTLLLLLAIAGGGGLFVYFFKPVNEQIPLPAKGEAAYNPLYALKKALQAQGVRATSYASLNPAALALGKTDTLVLFTRPEALNDAQAQRILDWVERGGHLVMPGPASSGAPGPLAAAFALRGAKEAASNKKAADEDDDDVIDFGDGGDCSVVWEKTPNTASASDQAKSPDEVDDADASDSPNAFDNASALSLCNPRFVANSAEFVLSGGDDERGYRFARRTWGEGLVSVTDLRFLDNRYLNSPAAAELAFQVLAPRLGQGAFHLVYSADVPSLWRLLLTYGWPVLLPLMLALIAWLAWRSQRLGPITPQPPAHRRALLEHVQAAGEFAFRRGRGIALHASVLNLFKQRLSRRDPAIAALNGEALVQALSERLMLDAQRIRHALQPTVAQRPDAFLQSISTLLQMRNRL